MIVVSTHLLESVCLLTYMSASEITKKRIRNAGLKLALDKGLHKLTTRDIAEKSVVSEATIFRYFKTKDELLNTICIGIIDKFANNTKLQVGEIISEFSKKKSSDYGNLLNQILVNRSTYFFENKNALNIILREIPNNPIINDLFTTKIKDYLISILNVIIQKGIQNKHFTSEINIIEICDLLYINLITINKNNLNNFNTKINLLWQLALTTLTI